MSEQGCTELAFRPDFPKPLYLYDVWSAYIHEHAMPRQQDVRRVAYVARHWFRIMGPDAEPATWKRANVDQYTARRKAEGVQAATIRRELCIQQAALNHARKFERIEKVPHFEKPIGEPAKRRPMTDEEFRRLMASPMPRRVRLFFILAFNTGSRASAIEELTWDRVDLEGRTIDFNVPGRPRNNKRRVSGFPISDALYQRLVAAKAYRDLKTPDDPYVIGLSPRGLASTTYHACKEALRAVGINELGLCRHTLRKTFVTERIKAGKNPAKVAALIADNPNTMHRHYSILNTRDLREAAEL